ncbi:phage tail protein [Rosenbergiella epipactidis]|uniref:phage tail protein n=1 Tax=Rosenbergiella epipactidis TaxID=1544694 RepID=UPI001F4E7690|nr:phage tail protein [Rosenbergiella epipactidis]
MSTKFYTLLTEIGAAKLANATALGVPLKITQMAVGDGGGTLPTPSAQQTKLVGEKRRAALNQLYIDPQNASQIIAEQVIPENEGGWWIREVGLFDESGALIAVGNCAESYKPLLAEGSGRTQTVRMILITSSTDNITLKIDPSIVLATRKYADDKADEAKNYTDAQLKGHVDASDPHAQYLRKNANLSDISDKDKARANLALKSAALRDVGKNSGNVMEVGAFGVGSTTGDNIAAPDNNDLKTGFYFGAGTVVGLEDMSSTLSILQMGSYSGWRGQLILSDAKDRLYYRTESSGKFKKTVAVYSENNKPKASDVGALDRTDFPIGIPLPWPSSTAPSGWLKCNGAPFDKTKYPALASAYPSGNLPDLRGEFIRGWDDGRGVDSGRGMLSTQGYGMPKLAGNFQSYDIGGYEGASGIFSANKFSGYIAAVNGEQGYGTDIRVSMDSSTVTPEANEVRPRNIAFNYIVRAA